MRTIIGAKSDVGRVRQGNEDSYLVAQPLFAVADGMGGHLAGDVASQTAIETITRRASENSPRETRALEALIKEANSAIWSKAQEEPSLHGLGPTCTLALVDDSQVHIGHVGDSRAYLFRDGELSQLTEDHTLVGRMVREGRLQPDEAERHPQRSIITRALGVDSDVDVDTASIPVQEGDRLLICSDGLTSMIGADDIADVLRSEPDPQRAVDRLVELANEAGGEDNVTAVVIAFESGESSSGDGVAGAAVARDQTPAQIPTAPNAPVAAPAQDMAREEARDDYTQAVRVAKDRPETTTARPSRLGRVLLAILLILAVLGVGGYMIFRYGLVENSYFVGVNGDGNIAIFQGLPDEVAGMTFKEEQEASDVALADLPDFLRDGVEDGIEADSLEDARRTVSNLEDRARDAEFEKSNSNENTGSKN